MAPPPNNDGPALAANPRPVPAAAAVQLQALLPDLQRVAQYLTRDRETADDLVQDIVLRLWRRLADPEKDPVEDLRHYAFSALRNRIRDRGARQLIEAQIFSGDTTSDDLAGPGTNAEGHERLICAETLDAIDKLPPDMAMLLRLQAVEGLSYGEIATRLNVPEGTVTSRLSRARAALRKALDLPPDAAVTFLLD